ncbi:MAG: tRNA (adenosine(37)-N6)-threonylcarbamoyltransferase complex dimerization subunit type 1 TsaB [Lachnospiraceae bacterium]|nr:tRNA (adenosine(37)-N6)-threonylcarbamoyltransferase complex dimerization subunit type 1 TsaB [Lachnospiraceae bacterium]
MILLALESASLSASAALLIGNAVVSEASVDVKKTHSETLLPMAESVMRMAGISPKELDAVAVSMGPGSFTGLRIGASLAKGLAFSVDKPIVPVPTIDAMAYGLAGAETIVSPILDARRSEVYTGLYAFSGNEMIILREASAMTLSNAIAEAQKKALALNKRVLFTGDGLDVHEETIRNEFPEALIALPHQRYQKASAVASYAKVLFEAGKVVSAEAFSPLYLRMSQAERERTEQGLSVEPGEGPDIRPENKSIPGVLEV